MSHEYMFNPKIFQEIYSIAEWFGSFIKGEFFAAVSGGFAGAFVAYLIAERKEARSEMLAQIRHTNVAISLALSILDRVLSVKGQYVLQLKQDFDQQRIQMQIALANQQLGSVPVGQLDLGFLQILALPTAELKSLILDRLSLIGRPLGLTQTLIHTSRALDDLITQRNELIEGFKANEADFRAQAPFVFFGLPDNNGRVDNTYASAISGIYEYVEDCIFFSKLLCEDLNRHGEQTRQRFLSRFREDTPRVSTADFSQVNANLLPPEEDYRDWIDKFVERPIAPREGFISFYSKKVRCFVLGVLKLRAFWIFSLCLLALAALYAFHPKKPGFRLEELQWSVELMRSEHMVPC